MKQFSLVLVILLTSACSSPIVKQEIKGKDLQGESYFELNDASGIFLVRRDIKIVSNKLINRRTVLTRDGLTELESTVSVSRIGHLRNTKNGYALLPEASQFKVWFDKKQFSSQMKIDRKTKKIHIKTDGPDEKRNGLKEYNIPKSQYFCFFSQLPECMRIQNLLLKAVKEKVQLFVIWDNYPYHIDQYENLIDSPLVLATLSLSDHTRDELKYSLDIGNQIIFYHFDKKFKFDKMFWISQGMSLISSKK